MCHNVILGGSLSLLRGRQMIFNPEVKALKVSCVYFATQGEGFADVSLGCSPAPDVQLAGGGDNVV